jgi:UDP-N-acetylmuramoylalanine--D-glutamate ligase
MFLKDNFINKNALILGFGKSGISASKILEKKLKNNIYVFDEKPIKTKYKKISIKNIDKEIKKIDFAIKSPGISDDHFVIKKLKEKNIPIYSEVELALSFIRSKNIIMITGTNGKSTTTYLTYLIINEYLKKNGKKAVLCGNIGTPVSSVVDKVRENDWVVIEISSYQIQDSTFLKPKIAIILNITPDHIEHHGSFENYIKAKFKIFSNMDKNDTLIINNDDKILKKVKANAKILKFSLKQKSDSYYKNQKIIVQKEGQKQIFTPAKIPGMHNIENQMASILASLCVGVDFKTIQDVLNKFRGLEHRIEFVREINGVIYINDSKATNVDSTLTALKALGKRKNIYLILGGKHKNSPYTPLIPLIKKYVKKILAVGEATPIIFNDLKGYVEIIDAGNIKKAIEIAKNQAKKGDIVLLSPACASFDQFKNFEERGKKFKKWVNSL